VRTLVMGGTRFLGVSTVAALLRADHEVIVFHRGSRTPQWQRPVTHLIGDRTNPADLERIAALDVDAVLDMSAYTRAHTTSLLAVVSAAARFVHVSTVNVYRPSPLLPWPEETPYGPHPLWGEYATEKIGCELALREHRPAPSSTIAVRFPLVLGPGNFIAREEFVLNRLLDGEEILLPGDGQAVHQYVWIHHAAEALTRALDIEAVGFRPFNVASRRCNTSLEGFVDVCAEVAAVTPRVRRVGGGPTGEDVEVFNGIDCVFPFSNENTVADTSAAREAGLLEPYLPLHDMIAEALRYLNDHPDRRQWTRTPAEQRVMNRLRDNEVSQ
jgi:nucleoside-diphosphate-sugar epimerase